MNMICFPAHLQQVSAPANTTTPSDLLETLKHLWSDATMPVFRDKNQMVMERVSAMTCLVYFLS